MCFPVNFVKFLRKSFFIEYFGGFFCAFWEVLLQIPMIIAIIILIMIKITIMMMIIIISTKKVFYQ